MKKLIFLLFFPVFVFSQNFERQQKQQIRSSGTYSPSPSLSQSSRPSYTPQSSEFSQKYSVREQNRSYYNRNDKRPVIINDPYWNNWGWGWNRWNPMVGWNSFSPYFWYDDWGYRNPGRIYIYDNGKTDTLKRRVPHGTFGVQYNTENEIGAWVTFGTKVYFIVDYTRNNSNRIGTYYPSLTLDKVLPWNDRKLADEVSTNMFSVGVGRKIDKRVGVHLSLGVGNEERRFKYYDEMFVLSNNGEYTFLNYKKTITTVKIGTVIDISRNFVTKLEWDLGRGCISYGLGLKF